MYERGGTGWELRSVGGERATMVRSRNEGDRCYVYTLIWVGAVKKMQD